MSPGLAEVWLHDGAQLVRRGRGVRGGGPVAGRVAYQHPYTPTSIWNATLRDGITYHPATDPATVSFRAPGANVNFAPDWSWAVWYPKATDPVYPIMAASNLSTVYISVPVPANWKIPGPLPSAPGDYDAWVSVVMPDGRSGIDMYKTTPVYNTDGTLRGFTTSRPPARTDFASDGFAMNPTGPWGANGGINATASTWGMRASTWSYFGGAVRKQDVLGKTFRHAVQVALPNSSLKVPYVWPSRSQDADAADRTVNGVFVAGSYTGECPMGTRLAHPPVSEATLFQGLTSDEGRALAVGLMEVGAYVGDRSSACSLTAERPVETDPDVDAYTAALERLQVDWKVLQKRLVRVTGHTAALPGGPGAVRWSDVPPVTVVPTS